VRLRAARRAKPNFGSAGVYHGQVLDVAIPRMLAPVALLIACWGLACASEPSYAPPRPEAWRGFFHPAPLPGASINGTKQCQCRACDPASCCGAEQTESDGPAPAECNEGYDFPEQCGIKVQTCTPRCYSQVWRVAKEESCATSRPLVCCE